MEQYIRKSALVAEIEKWISGWTERLNNTNPSNPSFFEGGIEMGKHILSFLNTLEAKETVDAEIVEVEDNNNSIYAYTHLEICTDEDLSKICKAGDKAKVIIIKQK